MVRYRSLRTRLIKDWVFKRWGQITKIFWRQHIWYRLVDKRYNKPFVKVGYIARGHGKHIKIWYTIIIQERIVKSVKKWYVFLLSCDYLLVPVSPWNTMTGWELCVYYPHTKSYCNPNSKITNLSHPSFI